MKAALLALLLFACGRSEPQRPPPPHVEDLSARLFGPATTQLVTAIVDRWDSTQATLRLWHRDGQTWRAAGDPWPAVVGGTGLAWGDGLHGAGAPAGVAGPVKHEGDRKSPAGAFAVRGAYGYAKLPPAGTKLHYTPVEPGWQCVDDPHSLHYTQIIDRRKTTTVDWTSAEEMRRDDDLYTWVIDIGHNPLHTPSAGSCIFFHVWNGPYSTTVGCTAMDQPHLESLLGQIDPHAVYVLLPRAEYDALAAAWGLPKQ